MPKLATKQYVIHFLAIRLGRENIIQVAKAGRRTDMALLKKAAGPRDRE
jgi:hypothetical protein